MTVPTYVVIPTRDRRTDLLPPLVTELLVQYEFDQMAVFDNSPEGDAAQYLMIDRRLKVIPAAGKSIHEMWNEGWARAMALYKKVNIAFLNDDINVPDAFLSTLAHALRADDSRWCVYPDYRVTAAASDPTGTITPTKGTYQHGGMCGWAFMIRGEMILEEGITPLFDVDFQWWYGDDDLVRRIDNAGGLVCRVDGLGIDHWGEATASATGNAWTHEAKTLDTKRFREKYA